MSSEGVRQKLAAILAADVAGYTRLMADDERATIATLDAYRAVFRQKIESHGGRVVDMAGDSVLAMFDSATGAVEAAVSIQEALAEKNEALQRTRQMRFRIGVNSGDIHEKSDGTIYGDGVNVAARLEALADPDGIMVSETAYLQVRRTAALGFTDAGRHSVKNITEPVRAYRVTGAEEVSMSRWPTARIAAAAIVAILVIVIGAWWFAGGDETDVSQVTYNDRVDGWPSLIVRPLEVLSNDDDLVHFTRALNTEISNGLSLFSDLKVVPHKETVLGKSDFVLEGTVQRGPEKVRVVVALLEGRTGNKAWGRTYEESIENADLLAVQSQIASRIVSNVADPFGAIPNATSSDLVAQSGRPLSNIECTAFARFAYAYGATEKVHNRARDCLEELTSLDPDDAEAWAWLSIIYVDEAAFAFPGREEFDELAAAFRAARKSLALSPRHEISLTALGQAHFLAKDYEQALVVSEQATIANPFNTLAVGWAGGMLAFAGDWDRGLAAIDRARMLNSEAPAWIFFPYIWYHILRDEYAEAARYAQQAARDWNHPFSHAALAASYAHSGRSREARLSAARIRELDPAFADYAEGLYELWFPDDGPWPGLKDRIMTGLDKAGLFEDPNAPTRPVIAVLPFDNMSGDPEQEYFADGITEDIITRLTRYGGLGVIARNTMFQYRGQTVDARAVGETLGARYVLEGSVRRGGDSVRISAQLLQVSDGTNLWAEVFDRSLAAADIFAIQDEISKAVANALADQHGIIAISEVRAIADRPIASLSAYECKLRSVGYVLNMSLETFEPARACLETVTSDEPDYADAWALRSEINSDAYATWGVLGHDALRDSVEFANRAIKLEPDNQYAHWTLAYAYFLLGEKEQFIAEAETAESLNPSHSAVLAPLGAFMAVSGEWERGYDWMMRAIDLNPHYPGWINYTLVSYHLRNGDLGRALERGRDFIAKMPDFFWAHTYHAAVLGLLDRTDEAAVALEEALRLHPDLATDTRAQIATWYYETEPIEAIVTGLRKAGLDIPEPPSE